MRKLKYTLDALRMNPERGLDKSVKQGLKQSYFLKFLQFFSCEQKRLVHFVLNCILFNQRCFHLFYILSTDMPPPAHSFSVSIQKQAGLPWAWHIKLRQGRAPPLHKGLQVNILPQLSSTKCFGSQMSTILCPLSISATINTVNGKP